jgi:hypothetical protein
LQLHSLLETISQTEPHFVRCLKSNMAKSPQSFDSKVVIHQLRYSGLLEVCKIRQYGYPHRYLFETFYHRYRILYPTAPSTQALVEALQQEELIQSTDYCFGHTKIFLKDEAGRSLSAAWNRMAGCRVVAIQQLIRTFLAKRRMFHLKNTLINLKKGVKTRNYELLVESLAVYHHFEYHTAVNRPLISDAKSLVGRLKSERELKVILKEALQSNDVRLLESAIQKASFLSPPLSGTLVDQCEAKVKELTETIEALVRHVDEETIIVPPLPLPLPPLEDTDVPSVSSGSPLTDEENTSDSSVPTFQRRTIFWPPSPDSSFDLTEINVHRRHSVAVMASSLAQLPVKPVPIEIPPLEPRGRQLTKKHSIINSDTRSLSPVISPRIMTVDVPQRSFSPPPNLHAASNSPHPLPKMGIRTSMLTRQVSTADINDMETIHEIISDLVRACSTEEGITVDDIDPIEQALQQVQYTGSAMAKYASELMSAREELARARKQLELQAALDALTDRSPLWKIRNLVQQAEKLGMENYRGE